MPYLGNQLEGNYTSFETQTITGDGSTGYTLSNAVTNGKELLVYINNVKQEEGSGKSYTASGTTITFSDAVASGDSCYVVYLGRTSQTVSPPDGSLASYSGNTSLDGAVTINESGADVDFRVEGDTLTHALFVDGQTNNVMIGTSVAGRAAEGADRLTIADASHAGLTIRSGTGGNSDLYGSINFSDEEGGTGEYAGQIWYGHGTLGEKLVLATQGSNRFTVTEHAKIEDGNLIIGTSGHGIDFSAQTASSTATGGAEVLDHYEEGTFTPTWENVSNATFTVNLGRYTRIGREIACEIHLDINALNSASGNIGISNLPFTMNSAANFYGHTSTIHASGWNTNRIDLNGLVLPGTTRVLFYYIDTNGDAQNVDWAAVSTGNLLCKVMYLAP